MYLLTLLSAISMPSLSSSPWIRGAPQEGFSRHILRIRSRSSREMTGRPGLAVPHLPGPEKTKAPAMPGHDRFGADDGQRRAPAAPDAATRYARRSPMCAYRRSIAKSSRSSFSLALALKCYAPDMSTPKLLLQIEGAVIFLATI